MRKSFWFLVLPLLLVGGAQVARADSFAPTFTCTSGCTAPPTAPNATFPISLLTVAFDGFTFNLSLFPNELPADTYSWSANTSGGILAFELHDLTHNDISIDSAATAASITASGGVTFPSVGAPEPNSLALIAVALGPLMVMRKRASGYR